PQVDSSPDVTNDLSGSFLKKADFAEQRRAYPFVITAVERVRYSPSEKPKIMLTFAGTPAKRMTLNATNLKTLADGCAKQSAAWVGRTGGVYVEPTARNPQGATVGGLRIVLPKLPPLTPPAPQRHEERVIETMHTGSMAMSVTPPFTSQPLPVAPEHEALFTVELPEPDDISFAYGANEGR